MTTIIERPEGGGSGMVVVAAVVGALATAVIGLFAFGAGAGLLTTGTTAATLRRRVARSSSSILCALRAVTGTDTTDQCSTLGSFLSTSAVKTCVPSSFSLAAMVTGTSNTGLKFCRT